MRFIRKRENGNNDSPSWGSSEEDEKSHSMWGKKIKKILKKAGLC